MIRRVLCRVGLHSWFRQWDRWGSARVCRFCPAVAPEPDVSEGVDRG